MEVFPERDGNRTVGYVLPSEPTMKSEWRSSLKGMETCFVTFILFTSFLFVRMEVFPERDGNMVDCEGLRFLVYLLSEWRSSLKGMETLS